jgi:hypothetical protein
VTVTSWLVQGHCQQAPQPDEGFPGKTSQHGSFHKKLSPLKFQRADVSTINSGTPSLGEHKTTVQNRLMLLPKAGITPSFEFVDLFRYQHSDSFSQLFFKETRVKTHFCEHSFDIIQHNTKIIRVQRSKKLKM